MLSLLKIGQRLELGQPLVRLVVGTRWAGRSATSGSRAGSPSSPALEDGALGGDERAPPSRSNCPRRADDADVGVAHPLPPPLLADLEQGVDRVARVRPGGGGRRVMRSAPLAWGQLRSHGVGGSAPRLERASGRRRERPRTRDIGPEQDVGARRARDASICSGSVAHVADDQQPLAGSLARPRMTSPGRQHAALPAMPEGGRRAAKGDEAPVMVEHRAGSAACAATFRVAASISGSHGVSVGEAAGARVASHCIGVRWGSRPERSQLGPGQIHRILLADLLAAHRA